MTLKEYIESNQLEFIDYRIAGGSVCPYRHKAVDSVRLYENCAITVAQNGIITIHRPTADSKINDASLYEQYFD